MSKAEDDKKENKVSRRNFIIGIAAGAAVAAVAVAGAETLIKPSGATTTTTVTTGGSTATATTTATTTATATKTVTTTAQGGTSTVTQTVTNTVTATTPAATTSIITLNVNGRSRTVDVDNRWSLADTLRYKFNLIGTKVGCDRGECGSCAVLVDGVAVLSCTKLAVASVGHTITTIEGIGMPEQLSPLQAALCDSDGIQCGACMPGIVVTATWYLTQNSKPADADWRAVLGGNICRCSNYLHILAGLEAVA